MLPRFASTRQAIAFAACSGLISFGACHSGGGGGQRDPELPQFGLARFGNPTSITNQWFPLPPGTTNTYVTQDGDERQTIIVEILPTTRRVTGIDCVRVRDRVYEGGLLIEDTEDWYAQDDAGNVWYMGEEVTDYSYDEQGNVIGMVHDGSWEAGKDVANLGHNAEPGYIMVANPAPGQRYLQEYYEGEAEDTGEIVALNVVVTLADGSRHACLQIKDGSRLAAGNEYKYFAPGIGKVREEHVGTAASGELVGRFRPGEDSVPDFAAATFSAPATITDPLLPFADTQVFVSAAADGVETIVIDRLPGTRTVAGVACAIVRDRVFVDGLLIEDTEDWYAQDDAGNVWYMGEQVDNYEYDEDGNLLGVDHEGSWEAGLDVANVGHVAEPGYAMPAIWTAGTSYHQEWYPGAATDIAVVIATGVDVELEDGRTFTGCLQTLDWNPLSPAGLEHKFYAPGIGLVREVALHDAELVDHVGTFRQGESNVPDFAAASFTDPTLVDNPLLPMPGGATWSYEKDAEDGLEEIEVAVQSAPRIVLGVACIESIYTKRVDGRLAEVARDWYAQDDDGNVWYMGEQVDNYVYDENGTLLSINHAGSWEAGLDVANVSHIARPGLIMHAAPVGGTGYYQEFYETAAEDMAFVVADDVTLTIGSRTFTDCLVTLDWNPLEPATVEYKYYAPGVGLVMEHDAGEETIRNVIVASSQLP